MIDTLLTTPCTIHNQSGSTVDAEGNVTPTYTDTPALCHRQPVRNAVVTGEANQGEPTAERSWRAWFPKGTPIHHTSTVTINGANLAVWGQPEPWESPDGRHAHVTVVLREVS